MNKISYTSLNEQQLKAVMHIDNPLLVIAGPGTGKTRVLTEKILHLIDKGFDASKILVSTFTIKAADEIKERIRAKIGDKAENIQISTIHSFCQKMLQTFAEYTEFDVTFDVLDDLDQFIYINKNYLSKYNLYKYHREQRIDVSELINFFNLATENDVNPKELLKELRKIGTPDREIAIARSYDLYIEDLLRTEEIYLDFALLQRELLYLLKNEPIVLNRIRDMYDYIIIDEYQDTNPIQDKIMKLISEPKYKITVVGDEDQSIYGFRGASVNNFLSFPVRYPSASKLELEQNYRSSPEIVKAYNGFMKSRRKFSKSIFTLNPSYSQPILLESKDLDDEPRKIYDAVIHLNQKHNIEFGDIAILFKSVKGHASRIIEKFRNEKIPFISIGDNSLLTKPEIQNMLLLLLNVNEFTKEFDKKIQKEIDSKKQESLEKTLKYYKRKYYEINNILYSDFLNLEDDTTEKLKDKFENTDFLNSFTKFELRRLNIVNKDLEVLMKLQDLQKRQNYLKKNDNPLSQLQLFYKIIDATNYGYRLFEQYNKEPDTESNLIIENLAKLSVIINKIETLAKPRDFESFLNHLDNIPENKLDDSASYSGVNAVKLMTIHQAKGLEFPVVIMAGLTKRRYSLNSREDTSIIEIPQKLLLDKVKFSRNDELLRTFYVGMSRAQKILIMSSFMGEKGYRTKASSFIEDFPKNTFIDLVNFNKKFGDKDHYVDIIKKKKLSYSSITAYISCPFRFYCRDIIKFQTPEFIFQKYGIIVHNVLQKLHLLMKEENEINITDVIRIVDTYCRDEESIINWRDELISDIWTYYERTPYFIKHILEVEYPFSYINKDLIINGQVDLIIINKNNEVEIIDYKSRYQKGLSRINVDIQLRLYNIALQNHFDKEIEKISAYTFKDNKRTVFTNDKDDLEKTKELIVEISNNMENNHFERKWNGKYCDTAAGKCEFFYICKNLEENR